MEMEKRKVRICETSRRLSSISYPETREEFWDSIELEKAMKIYI